MIATSVICAFFYFNETPEKKLLNDICELRKIESDYKKNKIATPDLDQLIKIAFGGFHYGPLGEYGPYYRTEVFSISFFDQCDPGNLDANIREFLSMELPYPYVLCIVDTPAGQHDFPTFSFRFSDSSLNFEYTPPPNIREMFSWGMQEG